MGTMITVSAAETIVLVHGSCHGGWCWNKLIPFLKGCVFEIHTPTLTGLGERSHLLYEKIDSSYTYQRCRSGIRIP